MKSIQLEADQLELVREVASVAFTNPFSEDRQALESDYASLLGADEGPRFRDELSGLLADQLAIIMRQGKAKIGDYAAEIREDLTLVCQFALFLQHRHQIDKHIDDQLAAGPQLVPVEFAAEVTAKLKDFGLSADQIDHTLALYYQLRRAYRFIRDAIAGQSHSISQVRNHLWRSVCTHNPRLYERHLWNKMDEFSTILLGATGTGKSSVAQAIGRSGYIPYVRSKQQYAQPIDACFLAVNLAQFSKSVLESELFGHRKGAFTGAIDHHRGVFSHSSPYGSIFLDEIGDIEHDLQAKLLTILQDRQFSPVGSRDTERFHGRVIAATNRDIHALRVAGEFRDDLYYRLCTDVIVLPDLRQRVEETPEELATITKHILQRFVGDGGGEELSDWMLSRIKATVPRHYTWPGNVRELEQCIRRILITNEYDVQSNRSPADPNLAEQMLRGNLTAQQLLGAYARQLYDQLGTYEAVAKTLDLDRRTVKKHLDGIGSE